MDNKTLLKRSVDVQYYRWHLTVYAGLTLLMLFLFGLCALLTGRHLFLLAALPAVLFGCGGSLICVRGLTRICKKCEHYTFVRTALRCPREQTGRKTYFLVEINGQMRHTRRIFNTAGVGTPAVDCYGDRTAVVGHNPKTGEVVVIRHFTAEERSKNFEVG